MPGSRPQLLVIAFALAVLMSMLVASRMAHLGYLGERGLDYVLVACAFCTVGVVGFFLRVFKRAERHRASRAAAPHSEGK
jgi:hypothetical protein